jgi:hypothetical protein
MVGLGLLKIGDAQNRRNIMSKWILTPPLILMTMVGMIMDSVRTWKCPLIGFLHTLKRNSGARLSNAPESLENGDVGVRFQLKMLEFVDFGNQNLKCGKDERASQDKLIELLMMQGARPSSSTKKLAKVYMLNTFLELGKANKV